MDSPSKCAAFEFRVDFIPADEDVEVGGQEMVEVLKLEALVCIVVLEVAERFLELEAVGKVEEGPVSLVLAEIELLIEVVLIILQVVEHLVVVGGEDVGGLSDEDAKGAIALDLFILLYAGLVDCEADDGHNYLRPEASVDLRPSGYGVFGCEGVVSDFLLKLLAVVLASEPGLEQAHVVIHLLISVEGRLGDFADNQLSKLGRVADEDVLAETDVRVRELALERLEGVLLEAEPKDGVLLEDEVLDVLERLGLDLLGA